MEKRTHQLVFPLLALPVLSLGAVAGVVVHVVVLGELHRAETRSLQVGPFELVTGKLEFALCNPVKVVLEE